MRLFFLGLLLFSCFAHANEFADSKTQLQVVLEKIKDLTTQLMVDEQQEAQLQEDLKELDLKVAQSVTHLKETKEQLIQTESLLKKLAIEYEVGIKNLALQQTALQEQIRGAFLLGQFDSLKLLLNQTDPHAVGRLLTYFDYFNAARGRVMQQIQADVDTLEQTKAKQLLQQKKLHILQTEQTRVHAELNEQKQAQSKLVETLLANISEKNLSLETLQADKQALESVIVELESQPHQPFIGNTDKPLRDHKGRLSWPVQGKVLHHFGEAFVGENTWQGILIAAPEGMNVRSIYKGRVVYADWLRGFGLIIIVDHGDGYMSLYAHNQSLYKNAGDVVNVGEPIAQVGKSGPVANTGLYFEIRSKGEVQNPMPWLAPMASKS